MFHGAKVTALCCALLCVALLFLYNLRPGSAKAASTVSNDTVVLVCTYDQSTAPNGMVPVVFDKSANAPAPTATNSCAQIISGYLNAGFRIQGESLEMPTNWAHFHLTRP